MLVPRNKPEILLKLPARVANEYPIRTMWMGYYQAAFFEDPAKLCNCRWEDLYKKLQRYYDVQDDINFFKNQTKMRQYPLRRNPNENGAPTVTVVLDEPKVGTHVFVGSVTLDQAKLIFGKGQEHYAFDADTRVELDGLINQAPAKAKKVKEAETETV